MRNLIGRRIRGFMASGAVLPGALLARLDRAFGPCDVPDISARTAIAGPDHIRLQDGILAFGPRGHEVAIAVLRDLKGVLLAPVRGQPGTMDAVFRYRQPVGTEREYAGTFLSGTPAFDRLRSVLRALRL